jgi:hydroxyacylglutathione hydrolase
VTGKGLQEVADGIWVVDWYPPYAINVYLAGDVLVDAATRHAGRRIRRAIDGREVSAHVLTHAHPDHQGASHELCTELGLPLLCGASDADAVERGDLSGTVPDSERSVRYLRKLAGPAHPVATRLGEGDRVGEFEVLDAPGHSPGHIALWREADRTLILGDVLTNLDFDSGAERLGEPPADLTLDPERNRESARRLMALAPALALFGHGPPVRDPDRLAEFVAGLEPPARGTPSLGTLTRRRSATGRS